MGKIVINELGEYRPGSFNSLNPNKLKEFATVPYFIDWYTSKESNKIFPLFLQEISDLNPTSYRIPGILTRNPFFDHAQIKYFIAHKNDIPVGRIMAFIDYNYNKEHDGEFGWLGHFESTEEKEVSDLLIKSALDYLKDNSAKQILGPAKFNAGGEIGLLIDGFDKKHYVMEPYNAPYYQDFFEGFGFKKENDWYSIHTDETLSKSFMDRVDSIMDKLKNSRRGSDSGGINFRNVKFKDMKKEIKIIKDLYNPIWAGINHPQQVQMTDAEFNVLAVGIKAIALEELMFIVEKDSQPIGVAVNIPDINEVIEEYDLHNPSMPSKRFLSLQDLKRDLNIFNRIKKRLKEKNFSRLRILILGVKKEYRKAGIDLKLYYFIKKNAVKMGITHGSASQLADVNLDIINPIFKLGKVGHTWRVYGLKT